MHSGSATTMRVPLTPLEVRLRLQIMRVENF